MVCTGTCTRITVCKVWSGRKIVDMTDDAALLFYTTVMTTTSHGLGVTYSKTLNSKILCSCNTTYYVHQYMCIIIIAVVYVF